MSSVDTSAVPAPTTYKCGTLEYTKRALVTLFLWLLWGDFCFMCMEMVHPTVLPLTLKSLGASNMVISVYLTSIMSVMNFLINPMASFKSDRYRSKWGRRRPFLMFATPFVALFLILTAFSTDIGHWLHRSFFSGSPYSANMVTIALIGLLVVGYQFFHMIVGSVYYYLFNDVVPEQFLGRFMALFRAVGTGVGALYSFFVYKYAETHGKEIFIAFGLIYLIGFGVSTLMVKEGKYPPPPKNVDGKDGFWPSFKTFFKESFFTNSFYWKFYAIDAMMCTSYAISVFSVFWYQSMGISLDAYGKITGVISLVSTLLLIPAGMLSDKKHPLRTILLGVSLMTITAPLGLIFLFGNFSPETSLKYMMIWSAIQVPGMVIYNASALPLFMRLLPHSRYGQFSAANAMVRSVTGLIAGFLAGWALDLLKPLFPQHDYYYRFIPLWIFVFQVITVIAIWQLFRSWKARGGDDHYTPPEVGNDAMDATTVGSAPVAH